MKKGAIILVSITVCFLFLITGIFIGRQMTSSGVAIHAEATGSTETTPSSLSDGKININTAGVDELMLLPGIGETIANRIIEYRNANGPFRSVFDLNNVSGIGEKRVEEIAPYITTGG